MPTAYQAKDHRCYQIAILAGDGVGVEVMAEAVKILDAIQQTSPLSFDLKPYPCGAGCYLKYGDPLPETTVEGCRQADAVL